MPNVTLVLGDKAIEVAEKDAPILEAFKTQVANDRQAVQATHDAAIADLNRQLAERDAKIAELENKVLDEAALDAAVTARADLIAQAKVIVPDFKPEGLSNADIRKAVVVKKLGDTMKDKPEAYIDARFDILVEESSSQQNLRQSLAQLPNNSANDSQVNDSRAEYLNRLTRRAKA